jgi:hypothetical protein
VLAPEIRPRGTENPLSAAVREQYRIRIYRLGSAITPGPRLCTEGSHARAKCISHPPHCNRSMAHTNQLSTFRSDVATLCKILIINCEPRSEKMLREMIALDQTLWLESGEAIVPSGKWLAAGMA